MKLCSNIEDVLLDKMKHVKIDDYIIFVVCFTIVIHFPLSRYININK